MQPPLTRCSWGGRRGVRPGPDREGADYFLYSLQPSPPYCVFPTPRFPGFAPPPPTGQDQRESRVLEKTPPYLQLLGDRGGPATRGTEPAALWRLGQTPLASLLWNEGSLDLVGAYHAPGTILRALQVSACLTLPKACVSYVPGLWRRKQRERFRAVPVSPAWTQRVVSESKQAIPRGSPGPGSPPPTTNFPRLCFANSLRVIWTNGRWQPAHVKEDRGAGS